MCPAYFGEACQKWLEICSLRTYYTVSFAKHRQDCFFAEMVGCGVAKLHLGCHGSNTSSLPHNEESINDSEELKVENSEGRHDDKG
jgi:hypothetical protein